MENNKLTVSLYMFNVCTVVFFLMGVFVTSVYFIVEEPFTNNIIKDIPSHTFQCNDYMSITLIPIADTNSMLPGINGNMTILGTKNFVESDLKIGNIIVYKADKEIWKDYVEDYLMPDSILHRIVGVQVINNKKFYILAGDSNPTVDPQKIEYSDVEYISCGLIYSKNISYIDLVFQNINSYKNYNDVIYDFN